MDDFSSTLALTGTVTDSNSRLLISQRGLFVGWRKGSGNDVMWKSLALCFVDSWELGYLMS